MPQSLSDDTVSVTCKGGYTYRMSSNFEVLQVTWMPTLKEQHDPDSLQQEKGARPASTENMRRMGKLLSKTVSQVDEDTL